MAKKIKVQEEEIGEPVVKKAKGNIDDLEGLSREFKTGKMVSKKQDALRKKLVELYKSEKITEEEQELMESMLLRERKRNTIKYTDAYILNKIEFDRLGEESICVVKTPDAPVVHHLHDGLVCKFVHDPDYNDNRNRPDSVGRFYVYVPRTIPTEHQLQKATVIKENKGHPTDPSEYPAPKEVIHFIPLKEKEFKKWFEVQDDSLLTAAPSEPAYTF